MSLLNMIEPPDDERVLICVGCARTWRPDVDVSPGEADGICRDCWQTEDPEAVA